MDKYIVLAFLWIVNVVISVICYRKMLNRLGIATFWGFLVYFPVIQILSLWILAAVADNKAAPKTKEVRCEN